MIVRDKDVLVDLSARAGCSVCISVPCVDEDVWRALEPGTAHPLQRLRAVRELVDAGIRAGVLMNPIVPGHLVEAGAARADGEGDRRPRRALRRLQRDVPRGRHARPLHALARGRSTRSWSTATSSSTPRKYAPTAYRDEVKTVIEMLKAEVRIGRARGSRTAIEACDGTRVADRYAADSRPASDNSDAVLDRDRIRIRRRDQPRARPPRRRPGRPAPSRGSCSLPSTAG